LQTDQGLVWINISSKHYWHKRLLPLVLYISNRKNSHPLRKLVGVIYFPQSYEEYNYNF